MLERSIVCAAAFSLVSSSIFSMAALAAPVLPAGTPANSPDPATPAAPAPVSPALQATLTAYAASPDQTGFDRVIAVLKDAILQPPLKGLDASVIIKGHPQLQDLGTRVIDAGGAKVWTFTKTPYAQSVILVFGSSVPASPGAPATSAYRSQVVSVPGTITITDAHIVSKSNPAPAPASKSTPKGAAAAKAAAAARAAAAAHAAAAAAAQGAGAKYLVLAGTDKTSGLITLFALKPADGWWVASPELFSSIPPFLLSSVQGRASFSGSDLVLSIASNKPVVEQPKLNAAGKPVRAQSSSYKLVLKLVNGRYVLEGRSPDEGPVMVVHNFLNAVQQGRQDVAKAWVSDTHLANIPKYLGLYGKSDQNYKVIAMSNPMGVSRFRVVTFGKDDLIIDVGMIKKIENGKQRQYVAIKSLFIAPPDPFAKKLLGATPNFERIPDPTPTLETKVAPGTTPVKP